MEKFNNYFLDTIKNRYVDFKGRSTRSEYWYFILFVFIISIILSLVDTLLINPALGMTPAEATKSGLLAPIFALAVLLPKIAVAVRRLHDIGKSGWWYLIILIPIIGVLVLIYFWVQDSQVGENMYGPNPK
ncbi:MAG: DUF805 domain-containing protein [Sulfurovum sp.]|uniref:DUF805 domain-containing protein n=1 Tax=Sulfurovum sp. TaxID=1969726 RepID=UPI003C7815E0